MTQIAHKRPHEIKSALREQPQAPPFDPELRDMLAALAPITLQDALLHSGLAQEGKEHEIRLHKPADRAVALSLLASMRYEYADAMLEARVGAQK